MADIHDVIGSLREKLLELAREVQDLRGSHQILSREVSELSHVSRETRRAQSARDELEGQLALLDEKEDANGTRPHESC